jgi:hypothetical protein
VNCGERIIAVPQVSEIQGRFKVASGDITVARLSSWDVKGKKDVEQDARMELDGAGEVTGNRRLDEIAVFILSRPRIRLGQSPFPPLIPRSSASGRALGPRAKELATWDKAA